MNGIDADMLSDLLELGVRPGGRLLVHASYKSLGHTAGGPDRVLDTLLAAVGEEGTLLMPALSYENVTVEYPFFDARQTRSCVGLLPERFRQRPGVYRSIHPTHSVSAFGRDAEKMTRDHRQDITPVGPNSPFQKLRDMDGQILFIGCGLRPNTSMHGVEERVEPPYLFYPASVTYTCVDENGQTCQMNVRRHNFTDRGREVVQRYDRLSELMTGNTLLYGKLLKADCFLLEARAMWDTAEAALRQNPLYFVD